MNTQQFVWNYLHFEWDAEKAEANERKHSISFETAARVFLDPGRQEELDAAHDETENRWKTTGMVAPEIIVVIYTERGTAGEITRIISARKANAREKRQYYSLQS
jgi:uncharacterized DUF497 family protein